MITFMTSSGSFQQVWLVTSNHGKFREVREIGRSLGVQVVQARAPIREIRGSLQEIAGNKAHQAHAYLKQPVVVDDAGVFIRALGGFPGPFASFVFSKIGNPGILKLMEGVEDRHAEFKGCAVYFDGEKEVLAQGKCEGSILEAPRGRGKDGFGYDPIFVPAGHHKTFAEDHTTKMQVSYRTQMYRQLFSRLRGQEPE